MAAPILTTTSGQAINWETHAGRTGQHLNVVPTNMYASLEQLLPNTMAAAVERGEPRWLVYIWCAFNDHLHSKRTVNRRVLKNKRTLA